MKRSLLSLIAILALGGCYTSKLSEACSEPGAQAECEGDLWCSGTGVEDEGACLKKCSADTECLGGQKCADATGGGAKVCRPK